MSGRFVTFEGGDAVGKSTQVALLAARLRDAGADVVVTREPGGTPGAERLRALLLDPVADWAPGAEILLHFAARHEHLERLILPALARGATVLCDRFADSTLAYQGWGRGADRELIGMLTEALPRRPDRTVVLAVDAATRRARLALRGGATDRYEREDAAFHARVDAGFRAIAAAEPARCVLVDGSGPADAVAEAVAAGFGFGGRAGG